MNTFRAKAGTAYDSVDAALMAAVSRTGIPGLRHVFPHSWIEDSVEFRIDEPECFTFWTSEFHPKADFDIIHVIASYHPILKGMEQGFLINGDTNTCCFNGPICRVHCPESAQEPVNGKKNGSWKHVSHPFFAKGSCVSVRLDAEEVLTEEGVGKVASFLLALLGKSDKYVAVSGGFNAPLRYSGNRLMDIGRPSPWAKANYRGDFILGNHIRGAVIRGSEQKCVWAYRVLQEEGSLEGSYVPPWFIDEGWLEIYEGAEVRHGLF